MNKLLVLSALVIIINFMTMTLLLNSSLNLRELDKYCHESDNDWIHFTAQTGNPQTENACWNYAKAEPNCNFLP